VAWVVEQRMRMILISPEKIGEMIGKIAPDNGEFQSCP
jgi:hypothetical protein